MGIGEEKRSSVSPVPRDRGSKDEASEIVRGGTNRRNSDRSLPSKSSRTSMNKSSSSKTSSKKNEGRDGVICSLLFGSNMLFFLCALHLGKQLSTCSSRKRYLLHDEECLHEDGAFSQERATLLKKYWRLKKVKKIRSEESVHAHAKDALRDIFTKLRLFEVFPTGTEILFLDLDLLVGTEIEQLFSIQSPAARYHGYSEENETHGTILESAQFQESQGRACVNAGVMRLASSKKVLRAMEADIESMKRRGVTDHKSYLPEQYFLVSRDWFQKPWFILGKIWNQEVDTRLIMKASAELDESAIIHFSSNGLKPWDYISMSRKATIAYVCQTLRIKPSESADFLNWMCSKFQAWAKVLESVVEEVDSKLVKDSVDGLKGLTKAWSKHWDARATDEHTRIIAPMEDSGTASSTSVPWLRAGVPVERASRSTTSSHSFLQTRNKHHHHHHHISTSPRYQRHSGWRNGEKNRNPYSRRSRTPSPKRKGYRKGYRKVPGMWVEKRDSRYIDVL